MSSAPESSLRSRNATRHALRFLCPTFVFLIALGAFTPALSNGFVNWDDDKLLLENQDFRGLDRPHIAWMFTTAMLGHYQPLVWLSYAIDHAFWGMDPRGYHLTNILLHAMNAVLCYLLARRLLVARSSSDTVGHPRVMLAAALAALLYAVHPLRVESVAWVTERRDVLCLALLIPAVICYLRHATRDDGDVGAYAVAIILFFSSFLAKAWGLTLPIVLLLLDAYLGRHKRGPASGCKPLVIEKLPFMLISVVFGAISWKLQSIAGMESAELHPLSARLSQAGYGLAFYLVKTFAPLRLSPLYELPRDWPAFLPTALSAWALVSALTLVLWLTRRRWPAAWLCWAIHCVVLTPVLGLFQTGPQLVADRYSYVVGIAWSILVASLPLVLLRRRPHSPHLVATARMALLVLVPLLGGMTWKQIKVWSDSWTLWNHCLTLDPDCGNAHNNVGVLWYERGDYRTAISCFERAVALNPRNFLGFKNLAASWMKLEDLTRAREAWRAAAKLAPNETIDKLQLTIRGLEAVGAEGETIPLLQVLIGRAPNDAVAQAALGKMLLTGTRPDRERAIELFQRCVELLDRRRQAAPAVPLSLEQRRAYRTACVELSRHWADQGQGERARELRRRAEAVMP